MPALEATQLTALVRAKDEAAELKLVVNASTTLGELLRYWNWRDSSDNPAEGFLLDLSIVRNQLQPVADVDTDLAEHLWDSDVGPRIPASAKGKQKRLLSDDSEESDLQILSSGKRKIPLQASTRINEPPAKRTTARKSTAASKSEDPQATTPASASTPAPRRSIRRSTINARRSEIQPDALPEFVRVNGWESGTVDPQGRGFHMRFDFYTGLRDHIYYFVKPSARFRDLCQAACIVAGVPHDEMRFLSDGARMLFRGPGDAGVGTQQEDEDEDGIDWMSRREKTPNQTVEAWGFQDGDTIDAFPPQYG